MTNNLEVRAAWIKATPAARISALTANLDALADTQFSLGTLAQMGTLEELVLAAPGAPINDSGFFDSLLSDGSEFIASQSRESTSHRIKAPAITQSELDTARMTPDCIVERLLYADVGCLIAPGGVGKTTLMLHTAMNITLGRDVFGESVRKRGRVLILTAEDSRQILVARLRASMEGLTDAERATVRDGVRIADVSGLGIKLTDTIGDVVLPSERTIDALLELCREIQPVLIVIDPAVSFGVGESRVNDAEQGLVEAARRLRNELNCCVLYVHHSGKANARERTLDQYSGRGGSAFADGSRMVLVLQNLPPDEFESATGQRLESGETGLILARPKMSYCVPPGDIHIRRTGYAFERVNSAPASKAAKTESQAEQVWLLLSHELKEGRHHSKHTIEQADAGNLKRGEIRAALAWLEAAGRVELRDIPGVIQRGKRQYLHPVGSPEQTGEANPETPENANVGSPTEKPFLGSPPYREITWRRGEPPKVIPFFLGSPKHHGEATARRGEARKQDAAKHLNVVSF